MKRARPQAPGADRLVSGTQLWSAPVSEPSEAEAGDTEHTYRGGSQRALLPGGSHSSDGTGYVGPRCCTQDMGGRG